MGSLPPFASRFTMVCKGPFFLGLQHKLSNPQSEFRRCRFIEAAIRTRYSEFKSQLTASSPSVGCPTLGCKSLNYEVISFSGLKDYNDCKSRKQEKTMSKVIFVALMAITLGTTLDPTPAAAASLGNYEVFGVENDDMLKLRMGPGIGYKVIVGLPNGTAVRVHSCQQTGGTRWCIVSLKMARGLKGHVSWAYLRKM